jgi:hypothetical protein
MGDFWGYYRYNPSIYDKRGLSLICANTEKGNEIINKLNTFEKYNINNEYSEYAFRKRKTIEYGYEIRNEFYSYLHTNGWDKTIKKYKLKPNIQLRTKRYLTKAIRKLKV